MRFISETPPAEERRDRSGEQPLRKRAVATTELCDAQVEAGAARGEQLVERRLDRAVDLTPVGPEHVREHRRSGGLTSSCDGSAASSRVHMMTVSLNRGCAPVGIGVARHGGSARSPRLRCLSEPIPVRIILHLR